MSDQKNYVDYQFHVNITTQDQYRDPDEPKREGYFIWFECEGHAPVKTKEEAEKLKEELIAKFKAL